MRLQYSNHGADDKAMLATLPTTLKRRVLRHEVRVTRAVLCCAVLCCAVLCCAVLCCAVLCCAVCCWWCFYPATLWRDRELLLSRRCFHPCCFNVLLSLSNPNPAAPPAPPPPHPHPHQQYGEVLSRCTLLRGVTPKFIDALLCAATIETYMPRVDMLADGGGGCCLEEGVFEGAGLAIVCGLARGFGV